MTSEPLSARARPNLNRRGFLVMAAASGAAGLGCLPLRIAARGSVVNDISRLNPVAVSGEQLPHSTDEVRDALGAWPGPVSVGGGRFSMGGQIAAPDSLHLDMRAMNQVVSFDPRGRTIRVQAGITWRDVQDVIDRHDLSVKIMQSYSNFTVGGSVSVNCHGRYIGRGPIVNSIRAVQLVTPDGEVLELSRGGDSELFAAAFGSYGGLGVITEVELELEPNRRIERVVERMSLGQYPAFFRERVRSNSRMVLHNADLAPPDFDAPTSVSWIVTDKPLTEENRLVPRGLDYTLEQNAIWAITELPGGSWLREHVTDRLALGAPAVVWRNHEASLDTASLEPRSRRSSTYLLQEYFIPVARFVSFATEMARILNAHDVNALNVSIRHSPADTVSLLRWAPSEVFSFVLYYKQRVSRHASIAARVWTRQLIDAALAAGGRYYLPYRLDATRDQFERAYPEASAFAGVKARVDPKGRFRNLLWDRYLNLA